MADKIKAIVEAVKNDPELGKRLDEEFKKIRASSESTDPVGAKIKAIKAVFGEDVTQADLMRMKAEAEDVDPEEMKAVTGGNSDADLCLKDHSCFDIFYHDRTGKKQPCAYDWTCLAFWKHEISEKYDPIWDR